MRALKFLRDVRPQWQKAAERIGPPGAFAPSHDAALRHLAKVCIRRGVARLVRWFDGGPRGTWVEVRWPGRKAAGGILLRAILPGWRSSSFHSSLHWTMRLAGAIDELAGDAPFLRPVRFHISSLDADPAPAPRPEWTGTGRDAARIEVDFSGAPRAGALFCAPGVVGDVLLAACGPAGAERFFPPLTRALFRIEGTEAMEEAGVAALAVLHWWATAGLDEAHRLFHWFEEAGAASVHSLAARHPAKSAGTLTGSQVEAWALEALLSGLWQMVAHFEPEAAGEEEVAGWAREAHAAFRQSRAFAKAPAREEPAPAGSSPGHWALPFELPDAGLAWVPRSRHRPDREKDRESWKQRRLWHRGLFLPGPEDVFDGERTLAEAVLYMCVHWGLDPPSAARLAKRWIEKGAVSPVRKRVGVGRTVLYFAFGSCMHLASFRETVPRYDLLGPARLKGHRLAFTFESVGRSGGVADVVEDEKSEVWGVLYRIPRSFLPRLDAREGVHLGRYRRAWVEVEALGLVWPSVLTYTVASKAKNPIKPSDEYAGLIMEGARTMLGQDYCRRLEELFARLGVEPALPL